MEIYFGFLAFKIPSQIALFFVSEFFFEFFIRSPQTVYSEKIVANSKLLISKIIKSH
jgi:hypothetical protein